MPAVTTQKCSVRRARLRRVQQLINELIQINETADRVRQQMLTAGHSDGEVGNTVNAILASAGPTDVVTLATNDKLIDRIVNALAANATPPDDQIGWSYLAE